MSPRQSSAEEKLFSIVAEIEKATAENDGTYPGTVSGKLTLSTVLRMAGLNASYLEKKNRPNVAALKQRIVSELGRIGVLSPRHRVVMTSQVSRKNNQFDRTETIAVMQRYAEAELDYQATLKELDVARSRIKSLESQVQHLQRQAPNIIPITRPRS